MPDEVLCPGCDSLRELHPLKTVAPWVCSGCTLTPAEIDAVLAMRGAYEDSAEARDIAANCSVAEIDEMIATNVAARVMAIALAVADAPDSATIAARDERASGYDTAPAGDGKKPGPSCENCQDTGWVSTDVPGRAGPLTNICPKNCAAGQSELAAVLQNQLVPSSSTPLVSCDGCGIVRNAAIVRDPDVCPSCGVVGRQPVVT